MTDADDDGAHIAALLMTFFYRFMRPLVLAGKLYIAKPPLYRVNVKNQKFYIHTNEELDSYRKKYGDKIQVAFKQYPLPFHNHAEGAAVASLCANEQSSKLFWKMHDEMFKNQDSLSADGLKKLAKNVGLNSADFDKCMAENKYLAQVKADMEEGQKINVKSTPTFFINGQLIAGAQPLDVFTQLIDEELSK
jgi:protein-disulfide isomerase